MSCFAEWTPIRVTRSRQSLRDWNVAYADLNVCRACSGIKLSTRKSLSKRTRKIPHSFCRLFKISCKDSGPLAPAKSCSLDPLYTRGCSSASQPLSFQCYTCTCATFLFNMVLKQARVHTTSQKAMHIGPTLITPTADTFPILSSKLVERLVAERSTVHANLYALVSSPTVRQPTFPLYRETAVLKVHHDLVLAVDDCPVSQLALVDLNTMRHQILLCMRAD